MTDPSIVLDLIDAFRRSKCMFTAVSLGLFDYTPAPLSELTKRTRTDPDALERLLNGCVSLGLRPRRVDRQHQGHRALLGLRAAGQWPNTQ